MQLPTSIETIRDNLFESVDEMEKKKLPDNMRQKIIRLRDMYNFWLQYPNLKDLDIVLELGKRYGLKKSAAYEHIRIIKYLLGDLNKASKDYHRYKFANMIEQSFDMGKRTKDARAMAAASNYYGKYMQLDKDDEKDLGYDKIVVQPFEPTTDPTILGIKPIPNIRERIEKKLKQYWNDDIEDVSFEEVDFGENKLFAPPSPTTTNNEEEQS